MKVRIELHSDDVCWLSSTQLLDLCSLRVPIQQLVAKHYGSRLRTCLEICRSTPYAQAFYFMLCVDWCHALSGIVLHMNCKHCVIPKMTTHTIEIDLPE